LLTENVASETTNFNVIFSEMERRPHLKLYWQFKLNICVQLQHKKNKGFNSWREY